MRRFVLSLAALAVYVAPLHADWGRFGTQKWFQGPYFSALKQAAAEGKTLCVVAFVQGSEWCTRLADETFSDPQVADALAGYVCVAADLSRSVDGSAFKDARAEGLARRLAVRVFPTIFFVDPELGADDLIAGYIPQPAFLGELQRIRSGQGTLSALRRDVARDGRDIALRLRLADKLNDFGDQAGFEQQMEVVRTLDPDERSLPMRSRKRVAVTESMEAAFDDTQGRYDTTPLERFLAEEEHAAVLFDGWSYLARLYTALGKNDEARAAYSEAWKRVPDAQVVAFGFELADGFWRTREELTPREKKLALRVAEQVAKTAARQGLPDVQRASCLDCLACCYFMNGKRTQAVSSMREALALDAQNTDYATRLALFEIP